MISLKNKSRLSITVNLERGVDYGADERCAGSSFRMVVPVVLGSGEQGMQRINRSFPGALTWQPGETKANLPDAVANAPEVQRMIPRVLVVVD